ncbi:hypothetical protein ACXR2T_15150 [Leucobacter sp. HY1910]
MNSNIRALQKTADDVGISLELLWNDVRDEWHLAGNMNALWLPQGWREERILHTISFPEGWWIDVTATETLVAIRDEFAEGFPDMQQEIASRLTMSDVTGDDRLLTTTLASMLRDRVELDDGTLPLGIRFISKHGSPSGQSGHCWAYWARKQPGAKSSDVKVVASNEIPVTDKSLVAAAKFCKINIR